VIPFRPRTRSPITSSIGAAYAGALAITTTSGPGMALKTEALGLAFRRDSSCHLRTSSAAVRHGPATKPNRPIFCKHFSAHSEAPIPCSPRPRRRLLLGRSRSQPHRHQVNGAVIILSDEISPMVRSPGAFRI